MSEVSFLVFVTTSLTSAIPATVTLLASAITSVILPVTIAVALAIADLISAILASIEAVLVLILSPTVLLFPLRAIRIVLKPLVDVVRFLLAPLSYPVAGVTFCVSGLASFFLEFKFGTGAIVGLVAGFFLWRLSRFISYLFGWLEEKDLVAYTTPPLSTELESHDLPRLEYPSAPAAPPRRFRRPLATLAKARKSKWANGNGYGSGNGHAQ
ncbi:hypothetical protein jhhlp_002607 [Lomentospora prolificans]|uniref:Uncharacterized protein n=1 Tax=Lomentospora prolificans TaxID=41688 RepID=A0A2N3NEG7_9PEZI|nr:hypothetical protein jhhlp_002607 [Lomentospora prolificans]